MQFGTFLVHKQLVSSDQVIEALNYQQSLRIPLYQLACQFGLLTQKDVADIWKKQISDHEKHFGAVALEHGYLTANQISDLLEAQSKPVPPIGELLVKLGALERNDMEQALSEFHHDVKGKRSTNPM